MDFCEIFLTDRFWDEEDMIVFW